MAAIEEQFASESLDALDDNVQLAVIDFWATWCGPCKRYSPVFQRLARDVRRNQGDAPVTFLSVDVDRNQVLARTHRVKAVPTTVIARREKGLLGGKRWKEKVRLSGVVPYPKLAAAVQAQLDALA